MREYLNNEHDFAANQANGLLKVIRNQRIRTRRVTKAFLKAVKEYERTLKKRFS